MAHETNRLWKHELDVTFMVRGCDYTSTETALQ
nr:MAG TPA: hypothetical protein [Caudoviricetes sp.]